jgi:uncharacterized coiled-coil DUF342 family protein
MELWKTILIDILTSGTITGLVVAVVKTWMETRIKLEQETKLATLKAEFEEQLARVKGEQDRLSNEANQLLQVRLQVFPKLSELIYRMRNAAREIRDHPPRDAGDLDGLSALIKDFETRTYEFRLPLEQSGVFSAVHQYKRELQTFLLGAKDLALSLRDGRDAEGVQAKQRITDLYAEIDRLHQDIVAELVVLVFSRAATAGK